MIATVSRDPRSRGWAILPLAKGDHSAASQATAAALEDTVTALEPRYALDQWERERSRVVAELLPEGVSSCLAFSGGADSLLLARDLLSIGRPVRLLCLAVSPDARDAVRAAAAARELSAPIELVLVTDQDLDACLADHEGLLQGLHGTTQRVLAIAESLLVSAARRLGNRHLWTGHGPEAVLGGFHRRPDPRPEETGRMAAGIELNARRLNAVAGAHPDAGVTLVHPFFHPRLLQAARVLRSSGLTHHDLAPPGSLPKAALQNGSGIHYQLERLARADGFRALGAWFKHRLGRRDSSPVSPPVLATAQTA